jgi:hypothetical protein
VISDIIILTSKTSVHKSFLTGVQLVQWFANYSQVTGWSIPESNSFHGIPVGCFHLFKLRQAHPSFNW